MKKISKETNIVIAIAVYAIMVFVVLKYYPIIWWTLLISPVIYFSGLLFVKMNTDKKHRRERKKRNLVLLDEFVCWDANPSPNTLFRQYPLTKDECFDGGKLDRFVMDEVGQWEEPNYGILKQIKDKGVDYKKTDITIEDVREWKRQLDEAGIPSRKVSEIIVTEYDKDNYQLSGGAHGIVPKEMWHKAIFNAGYFQPVTYKFKD